MPTLIAATLRIGDGRKVANVYHAQMEQAGRGFVMKSFGATPDGHVKPAPGHDTPALTALEGRTELAGVLRAWAAILERGEEG